MFNLGTLNKDLLKEMVKDVEVELSALLQFREFGDVRFVTAAEGLVPLFTTPILISDSTQGAGIALDAPTPSTNFTAGSVEYKLLKYGQQIAISEAAEIDLGSLTDIRDKLVKSTMIDAYSRFNRHVASRISNTTTYVTAKAASVDEWDQPNGVPITDIDAVLKQLRGGQVDAIMGYDVALALSKNPQVTGQPAGSGHTFVDFDQVRMILQSRGVTNVYIDGSKETGSQRNYTREYAGIYDGLFILNVRGNIVCTEQTGSLRTKMWNDEERDVNMFKSVFNADCITGYKANTVSFTGILT